MPNPSARRLAVIAPARGLADGKGILRVTLPSSSSPVPRVPPHALSPDDLAGELKTSLTRGLDAAEVSSRQQQFGPNELREAPPLPIWRRLLGQFQDLVIWILIVAALISGVMGDITD